MPAIAPSPPPPPGAARRPRAVVLDVNGTLFPPSSAAGAFLELGLDPSLVDQWFASVLQDAIAAQLAGGGSAGAFVGFADVGAAHLSDMLRAAGKDTDGNAAMKAVAAAWRDADMFADVAPALRRLKDAGFQVSILTNGRVEAIAGGLVARAGLQEVVTPLMDVHMAQAFKPDPRAYRFAANRLGVMPSEAMMVASHPWDVNGALAAGLRGAYVERDEAYPGFLRRPELATRGFGELADCLLALEP